MACRGGRIRDIREYCSRPATVTLSLFRAPGGLDEPQVRPVLHDRGRDADHHHPAPGEGRRVGPEVQPQVADARGREERVARGVAGDVGPLLTSPLPRFPVPALRRVYQRAAYAMYAAEDRWA